MITRALVEKIVDEYSVKVRMPFFNMAANVRGATPTESLNTARICVPSSITPRLRVGDAVFIGFEDNDYGKPVVLGLLFTPSSNESPSDMNPSSMAVSGSAKLPQDTYIGEVSAQNIDCLKGVNVNLQSQINAIKEDVNIIRDKIIMTSQQVVTAGSPPPENGKYYGETCTTYVIQDEQKEFDGVWMWTTFNEWVLLSVTKEKE